MLTVLFWIGCGGILYAYFGFPALAALLAAAGRARAPHSERNRTSPTVSVIVTAYNEEQHIESKIRNVLATQYPRELLDIVVVSDGSTDRTNDIAASFEDQGVRLIVQEKRRGKTAGLNRAIELARGEIIVLTDANAMYPPNTIAALARYFRDPAVGLVTGYTRYVSHSGSIAEATNLYTSLERMIKKAESRWGCCVGADGAVFATRRNLFRPLRDDDINDIVIPMRVIEQGYRCVFAEDAFCLEHPGENVESEFRRQVRITNRTLRALWRNAHLLNPFRFGLFAFFLFSHKVIRFCVPVLLTLCALSVAFSVGAGAVVLVAAIGVLTAFALAGRQQTTVALARPWTSLGRLLNLLIIFLSVNVAVLQGWWNFLCGRRDVIWLHDR